MAETKPVLTGWVKAMRDAAVAAAPTARALLDSGEISTMHQFAIADRGTTSRKRWMAYIREELQLAGVLDELRQKWNLGVRTIPRYRPDASTTMYLKLVEAPKKSSGGGSSSKSPLIEVSIGE